MGRVVGIVAEYNPFHNGHYYHIQESKKKSNADAVVAVISGNFTQRGETSIVNKWSKAYMALCGGADLVIELPTVYATSSAENFARGAIKILDSLKIVNSISFGTENDDIEALRNIANVLNEEPKEYKTILNHELQKGDSFPKARENALMMYLNDIKRYANILKGSNNILAIEYLKILKEQKSKIEPITILRKNVGYNDDKIEDGFASSSAIRKLLNENKTDSLSNIMPKMSYRVLANDIRNGWTVLGLERFEKEIIYQLRRMNIEQIANLPDVSEGLENAIKSAVGNCNTIKELIEQVKTKRYTQTRIQRILLYSLLGIDKKIMESSKKVTPYVRVLGFTKKGQELLSEICRNNPKINLITSVKKFMDENKNKQLKEMLEKDIFATDVYTLAYKNNSKTNLDYTNKLIMPR